LKATSLQNRCGEGDLIISSSSLNSGAMTIKTLGQNPNDGISYLFHKRIIYKTFYGCKKVLHNLSKFTVGGIGQKLTVFYNIGQILFHFLALRHSA
jgi:hypothetical protein